LFPARILADPEPAWGQDKLPPADPEIVVTYFHRTLRCPTCRNMESMAEQIVREEFPAALETGLVVWRSLDIDLPGNADYVQLFALDGPALIIEGMDGPRRLQWRNLDLIWQFADDPVRFRAYVSGALHAAVDDDDFRGEPIDD
jgi:hypothetical protein